MRWASVADDDDFLRSSILFIIILLSFSLVLSTTVVDCLFFSPFDGFLLLPGFFRVEVDDTFLILLLSFLSPLHLLLLVITRLLTIATPSLCRLRNSLKASRSWYGKFVSGSLYLPLFPVITQRLNSCCCRCCRISLEDDDDGCSLKTGRRCCRLVSISGTESISGKVSVIRQPRRE